MCGLRDIPSQTKLIEFEDVETLEDLENYTDSEFDLISDRNSNVPPIMRMSRWIWRSPEVNHSSGSQEDLRGK